MGGRRKYSTCGALWGANTLHPHLGERRVANQNRPNAGRGAQTLCLSRRGSVSKDGQPRTILRLVVGALHRKHTYPTYEVARRCRRVGREAAKPGIEGLNPSPPG